MPITIKPTQLKYKDPSTSQYISVAAVADLSNIPVASYLNAGIVKTNTDFGTNMRDAPNQDTLMVVKADSANIKAATQKWKPIVPYHQHESVFYGLAKAAGADMSSSSNAVGIYTDAAKTAIQNMLSIPSSNDPVFTGSFSQNRKANTTVGSVSAVIGYDNAAEGSGAIAIGYDNRAYSQGSIALGNNNTIYGDSAVAIGYKNIAQYQSSFVFGSYNAIDTITDWASNVEYDVGDLVYNNAYVLECLTAHTSESTLDYSKWRMVLRYLFVIGNGNGENERSNALAVNIEGDLRLKNNLYVNCNADSSGGTRVPYDIQINGTSIVSNGIATIPIASDATFGVIKTREYTDGFKFDSNNNFQLAGPSDAQIKAADTNYRAITPYVQHTSVFYGLAKAAGDTTQSASSNAVGVYTDNAKASIKSMLGVNVDDVQINGTSIVSNGIANFPYVDGNGTNAGVCRIVSDYGIASNSLGRLYINKATSTQIPLGSAQYRPIVPYNQHESVFYGLAKAAGDATQSVSDNAVGTYTSSAKTAIKTMLDIPTLVSQLTNDSGFLTSVPTMTGATASTNGTSGLVPAPTSGDIYKFLAGDGTYRSGGLPMVILSYGNSTWSDFIEAYNNHVIVYCRASSNANPKTGSQTRMAFMAYVNNETTPTNVEFQYYRSMSSHSGTQMGDQVYVYKLDKTSGWSVTVRETGLKEIEFDASTGLKATWSNNKLTITTI